jgi:hypothetical protein
MFEKLWISKDIMKWDIEGTGGREVDKNLFRRSYEIWEHSKSLIENATNDFHLSDGITNLKRCLNHRLQLIESIYNFKKIDIDAKPKGTLELLQRYGIVRPLIIRTLLLIRNDIEHNDANPPSKERCQEFVDILWYFLKSTDSIVQVERNDVDLAFYDEDGNESLYGFNISVDFEDKFEAKLSGWFPTELVFKEYKENTFELIVSDIATKSKWVSDEDKSEVALDVIQQLHNKRLETDLYIEAKVNLKPEDTATLIERLINSN